MFFLNNIRFGFYEKIIRVRFGFKIFEGTVPDVYTTFTALMSCDKYFL